MGVLRLFTVGAHFASVGAEEGIFAFSIDDRATVPAPVWCRAGLPFFGEMGFPAFPGTEDAGIAFDGEAINFGDSFSAGSARLVDVHQRTPPSRLTRKVAPDACAVFEDWSNHLQGVEETRKREMDQNQIAQVF